MQGNPTLLIKLRWHDAKQNQDTRHLGSWLLS